MKALKVRLTTGAQWLAWHSGLLRSYHYWHHADTLTVFGLHRVLHRDDPRLPTAMPEWTVLDVTFRSALAFIVRHYSVVSLSRVIHALQDGTPLPPRAALISFDDGWADTADTAAPILAEMGLPAVVFVISGLVGSARGTWESEWYAALQRATAAELAAVRASFLPRTSVDLRTEWGLEVLCRRLRKLPLERRFRLLGRYFRYVSDTSIRQMMTPDDIRRLLGQGLEIGAHTVSHDPLVGLPTAHEEVAGSLTALNELVSPWGGTVQSFSFPHGSYDQHLVETARAVGAAICFSSDLALVPTPAGRLQDFLLGRVWVGHSLAGPSGDLIPQLAAWRYFRTTVKDAHTSSSKGL